MRLGKGHEREPGSEAGEGGKNESLGTRLGRGARTRALERG